MKVDYISLALNYYKYHKYCPPAMVRLRSSVGLRQSNRVSAPGDRTSPGEQTALEIPDFLFSVGSSDPLFLHLSSSKSVLSLFSTNMEAAVFSCWLLFLLFSPAVPTCLPTDFTLHVERPECDFCVAINTTICMGFCYSSVCPCDNL